MASHRRHLIDTISDLQQRDVGIRSLQEQIDTTTPGGTLVFRDTTSLQVATA